MQGNEDMGRGMTHTADNALSRRRMHHDPVEIVARKMAIIYLNEHRISAGMPIIHYVTKTWWMTYGSKWMRKASVMMARQSKEII
jgi:hypothetical protein